jgi:poly-gamma-glutamate synthesis protein (capsule biosynthesis protein)
MNTPIGAGADGGQGELSRGERSQASLERPGGLSQPDNMEALLATSRFEGGHLVEVRIYPIDVGKGYRPVSKIGIPLTPTPEVAREILEKVQRLSKPLGTNMTIENGVGVIRLAPQAASRAAQ